MIKTLLVIGALLAPGLALGCDYVKRVTADLDSEASTAGDKDPAACAKKVELLGHSCSYTTSMMAERVLCEGAPWTFLGKLKAAENALPSHVAAPFTIGPEDEIHVVANEVLEELIESGLQDERIELRGMRLDVDDTKYFVLTGYAGPSS